MNDVMKKRLIGVVILVIIGVLAPLLLSRCMQGGEDDNGRGSMRVYNVQPNGQAQPAKNSQDGDQNSGASGPKQASATNGNGQQGGQSDQHKPTPDAVSPQSKSEFSTPPVHGNSAGKTQANNHAQQQRQPSGQVESDASANSGRSAESQSSGSRSDSSHDYGSSVGNSGSSAREHSSSGQSSKAASSSGLENRHPKGWVVQVASFGKQDNAAAMVRKLKGQFDASFAPGQVNGKTWYRVNVGPFDNENAARSTADRLKQQGQSTLVRHLP